MADMNTVINGLIDIGGFIAGRVGFKQARNFLRTIDDAIELLKEQKPMTLEEFKDGLLKMFSSIWECEIDHPMFQDTVGELMNGVMQLYKKAVKWE